MVVRILAETVYKERGDKMDCLFQTDTGVGCKHLLVDHQNINMNLEMCIISDL